MSLRRANPGFILRAAVLVALVAGLIMVASMRDASAVTTVPTSCTVEARGALENGDSFNGEATKSSDSTEVTGRWFHVAPDAGAALVAPDPDFDRLACFLNGAQIAILEGGEGRWRGEPVEFEVAVIDDSTDDYRITVYPVGGRGGSPIYRASGALVRGDIEVCDPESSVQNEMCPR